MKDWLASMRPRHKAAENADVRVGGVMKDWLASMRPRHKAAENSKSSGGSPGQYELQ